MFRNDDPPAMKLLPFASTTLGELTVGVKFCYRLFTQIYVVCWASTPSAGNTTPV
jgi:hypothetical protein